MPQTTNQKKQIQRDRKRAAGLVLTPQRWIHPQDRDAVIKCIDTLNRKRGL